MTQKPKPVLRADVHAHAMRASQNYKALIGNESPSYIVATSQLLPLPDIIGILMFRVFYSVLIQNELHLYHNFFN